MPTLWKYGNDFSFAYAVARAFLFPFDIVCLIFGREPLSFRIGREYNWHTNESECREKYGMGMLDKIRQVQREILGEDEYDKIMRQCADCGDPWCGLDVFHDMMVCEPGMFNAFLSEMTTLWKYEKDESRDGK